MHGEFTEIKEPIHMDISQVFYKYLEEDYLLLLLKTLYGLKNAAYAFWCEILKAFKSMDCKRSKDYPCMYHCWTIYGLLIWLSWIDECLRVGHPH